MYKVNGGAGISNMFGCPDMYLLHTTLIKSICTDGRRVQEVKVSMRNGSLTRRQMILIKAI